MGGYNSSMPTLAYRSSSIMVHMALLLYSSSSANALISRSSISTHLFHASRWEGGSGGSGVGWLGCGGQGWVGGRGGTWCGGGGMGQGRVA